MYKLIVKNKGVIIIDKTLSKDECESIKTKGVQWICDAFIKYLGLNIGKYTILEYLNGSDYFIISIREEDLIKMREDKLYELLNK